MGYIVSSKTLKEEIESFRLAIELPADTILKSIKIIEKFKTTIKRNILQTIKARNFANQEFKKDQLNLLENILILCVLNLILKRKKVKL